MLEMRQATTTDCQLVESLLLQKVKELANKGIVQWHADEVLWESLKLEYTIDNFYLIYRDGEAVGCFAVVDYDPGYWQDDIPHEALYIHKVMVLDKASGSGVSDFILDQFKQLGREAKVASVKLDVREHKQKLRSFYERNGFTLVSIVDLNKGYLTALYEYVL